MDSTKRPGVAVFIDVENFISTATQLGLPIDIPIILTKLKEIGTPRLRRAYGDLSKTLKTLSRFSEFDGIRRMLYQNLVEIVDIPYHAHSKNTADIHLVLDALSTAYQNADITHYAIVSSDRDYVPLFNKLRELGKTVIAIGIDQNSTNAILREAADQLWYYSSLVPAPIPTVIEGRHEEHEPEDDGEKKQLLNEYYGLLQDAIISLEKSARKSVGTNVVQRMRELRSDFDPSMVGCATFKQFIQRAKADRAIAAEIPGGAGDMTITLLPPEMHTPLPIPLPGTVTNRPRPQGLERLQLEVLNRLHVRLPHRAARAEALEAIAAGFEELTPLGPFELRELSDRAFEKRTDNSVDRSTLHKILLTLYFARCFNCIPGLNPNNPKVVGLAAPSGTWETRLHFQLVRMLERRFGRLAPEDVAELLLDTATEENVQAAEELLEESREG